MDEPHYPYEDPITEIRYDFKSISNDREVKKRVLFTALSNHQIHNLALVDVFDDGRISDISETRNKDMSKVLATVMRIIRHFLKNNRGHFILFRGSDERRQRLYRLVIGRELQKIQRDFVILGGVNGQQPTLFEANNQYDYFIISEHNEN